MPDAIETHNELEDDKFWIEVGWADMDNYMSKYPKLKAAKEIIDDVLDDIRNRMEELEPLVAEQERREADAQRRDYLRGIGPL